MPIRRSAVRTQPDEMPPAPGPELTTFAALERGEIDSFIIAERYRVDRYLGRGGMASIYVGRELDTDQPVAVKVLRESAGELSWDDALPRFIQEAKLGRRVRHDNVVEIFDWGTTPEGVVYLVMELLRGEDLRATLERRGCLPWPRVRKLMLQLCSALSSVHRAGVVHRDLKPSNCFRVVEGDDEQLKLVDFGVATLSPWAMTEVSGVDDPPDDDTIVGTPEYMSPEQASGRQVDARADVYGAGLILCEMLTGTTPFRGRAPRVTLVAQIHEQPASLRQLAPANVNIDPRLEVVCARALAKDPRERFATIDAFAAALESIPAEGGARISGVFTDLSCALAELEQRTDDANANEPFAHTDDAAANDQPERPCGLSRRWRRLWRALAAAALLAIVAGSSCAIWSRPGEASVQVAL